MADKEKKSFVPEDMPANDAFREKQVYQHPQPAAQGKPLDKDEKKEETLKSDDKENNRTSKEEGLNEERSEGDGGAFEGFEKQGDV